MSETNLMRRIHVALSIVGARLFRNNVGTGWAGETIHIKHPTTVALCPGDVVIHNARALHAGLCAGSSDLIGWKPVQVTQDMVGRHLAVFVAVEVKAEDGRVQPNQKQFLEIVKESGGIAVVARSVQEAVLLLQDHRNDTKSN